MIGLDTPGGNKSTFWFTRRSISCADMTEAGDAFRAGTGSAYADACKPERREDRHGRVVGIAEEPDLI